MPSQSARTHVVEPVPVHPHRSSRTPVASAPWVHLGALAVLAMIILAPVPAAAQQQATASPQWEARVDALMSPHAGVMAGLGVNVRAGWYSRLGLAVSAGAQSIAGELRQTQRVDATARFLFDPFAESRRAFYAGAGLGALRTESGEVQGLLLGIVGVEGRSEGRIVPAVELTLGGGARLGVVLRSKRPQGR